MQKTKGKPEWMARDEELTGAPDRLTGRHNYSEYLMSVGEHQPKKTPQTDGEMYDRTLESQVEEKPVRKRK
jgi:uncharacterized short protein YbdD (DUF466 family)